MNDHDEIKLLVNGKELKNYLSYNVAQNIYEAESTFSFKTHLDSDLSKTVKTGDLCKIVVNSVDVFNGIIDSAPINYSNDGVVRDIQGRDLMGLVVDQYVQSWKTFKNKTLSEIAIELLREVPIVSKQAISFENGVESLNIVGDDINPEPGQTVFEVLNNIAFSRGVVFYIRNDGTFVFSKPIKTQKKSYSFIVKKGERTYANKSKIISAGYANDSREHYRNIIVVDNSKSSKKATSFVDETAPTNKTLVVLRNDGTSIEETGKNIINQQRFNAKGIRYTVSGHSQNREVFLPGKTASIKDDLLLANDSYVLYGVTYRLDKQTGITSELLFSIPAEN